MWEGSYGKEPFDLRLTVLRLMRELGKILALTLVGTIVFGGGYYVKNIILRPEPTYAATSTYKVQYVVEPTKAGDYYINEMSWNTLLQMKEFLDAVQLHLAEAAAQGGETLEITAEELGSAISAKLPSDWHVPTTTVETNDPKKSVVIAAAVEAAMMEELASYTDEISTIRVMDPALEAAEVELDVRPARAFILSALLSFFFVTVIFLLKETGDDSIWLPATLRRRYDLAVLGTINSPELEENIDYLFREKEKIAVCAVDGEVEAENVTKWLQRKQQEDKVDDIENGSERKVVKATTQKKMAKEQPPCKEWIAVASPVLCPKNCKLLREMDGILLVVRAGRHSGKPLEHVLEYLAQQDCKVTAAILWEADEKLLKAYYCFSDKKKQK